MTPCPTCHSHVHRHELVCPFCGADRGIVWAPNSGHAGLGAFALAAMTALGVSACSSRPLTAGTSEGSSGATVTDETVTETDATMSSTTGEDPTVDMAGGSLTFVPDSDLAALYGVCDTFAQDCPEGEKCVSYASTGVGIDTNKCVEVMGDNGPGDPCNYGGVIEATDDCDEFSSCWNIEGIEGAETGVCLAFCEGTFDDPMCGAGTSCLIAHEGSTTLCVDLCDPILQDCAAGQGCYWNVFADTFNCWRGEVPEGESCVGHPDDCAPGQTCTSADLVPMCDADACCTPFCDLGDPVCAPAGTACGDFFEPGMAPAGFETVGACVVPP